MSQTKITINHGISTSQVIYDLFRLNCQIIKPGQRFFPMCIQILKLEIQPKFVEGKGNLNYMADSQDYQKKPLCIFLAEELLDELNQVFMLVCNDAELRKEYLGLFPLVANDRGIYTVSIDLVPGGLDEYGCLTIKNKFFVTCRELDAGCQPAKVFSCVYESQPTLSSKSLLRL
jgi:hypothetical protein